MLAWWMPNYKAPHLATGLCVRTRKSRGKVHKCLAKCPIVSRWEQNDFAGFLPLRIPV